MNTKIQPLVAYLILGFFFVVTTTALQSGPPLLRSHLVFSPAQAPEPTPMMGLGRFEVPELPENPTQVEVGENLYFYHCMPCHGDNGQGLTDEFRAAWVEDHQNCWARGCHTGRPEDEGFPIPKYVPPVIASQILVHFPTAHKLFDFLSIEHPPQNPGILKEGEYWALTAFIWFENGQLPSGVELGPEYVDPTSLETDSPAGSDLELKEIANLESAPSPPPRSNFWYVGITLIGSGLFVLLVLFVRRTMKNNQITLGSSNTDE